eukprot:1215644-Prymnesium_polylepis.2
MGVETAIPENCPNWARALWALGSLGRCWIGPRRRFGGVLYGAGSYTGYLCESALQEAQALHTVTRKPPLTRPAARLIQSELRLRPLFAAAVFGAAAYA